MSEERCERCRFWQRFKDQNVGACRRYPPQFDTAAAHQTVQWGKPSMVFATQKDISFWTFPTIHADDWCGEFRATSTDS